MKSGSSYRYFKDLYLQMAHRNALRSVEWKPVAGTEEAGTPSAREGHMSCILADRYLVVTGGYTDDRMVHVKDLHHPEEDFVALEPSSPPTTPPEDDSSSNTNTLSFAYGATLTPINRHQALRFGGFRTCGYSSECSQVALLTISSVESDVGKCHLSAHWHVVPTNVMLRDARGELRPTIMKDEYLARAYHTATFLYDRYLLILGGMQSTKSIWDPAILDTQTWTWLLPPTSSSSSTVSNGGPSHPSPRHGHSTIWDVKRSRLLVFGGGNGNDLLRSGQDNTEVWSTTYDLCSSASGARSSAPKDTQSLSSSSLLDLTTAWRPVAEESNLSPAEALCLGRCHESHRVSPDTVLLLCGSGRPSTNGVLAFVSAPYFGLCWRKQRGKNNLPTVPHHPSFSPLDRTYPWTPSFVQQCKDRCPVRVLRPPVSSGTATLFSMVALPRNVPPPWVTCKFWIWRPLCNDRSVSFVRQVSVSHSFCPSQVSKLWSCVNGG